MKKSIFIIDDDPDMVQACRYILGEEGYIVLSESDPELALRKLRESAPDLILLDLRLGATDGIDVCREMKADPKIKHIPVIILSVKSLVADVVRGLEIGAEDYIRKPFEPAELLARVRTVIRRREAPTERGLLQCGPISVDLERYSVTLDGAPLALRPKEFELLAFFIQREGRVVTRASISEHVWGTEYNPSSKTIEVSVDQLRKKLGRLGTWIQVLKAVGYRFESSPAN